jgi:hypothetical protein
VPPALSRGENFSTGINFAVAGATALDLTYLQGHNVTVDDPPINSSLNDQLRWFEKLKPSLCRSAPGKLKLWDSLIRYSGLRLPIGGRIQQFLSLDFFKWKGST